MAFLKKGIKSLIVVYIKRQHLNSSMLHISSKKLTPDILQLKDIVFLFSTITENSDIFYNDMKWGSQNLKTTSKTKVFEEVLNYFSDS